MDSFSDASVNLSNFLGSVQTEATLMPNNIRLASYPPQGKDREVKNAAKTGRT